MGSMLIPVGFNPRTRTGRDLFRIRMVIPHGLFQSTHPHGVRLSRINDDGMTLRKFQSTHPHGVRPAAARAA